MTSFKREHRYLVLKWRDVELYLAPEETETLLALSSKIHRVRQTEGKAPFNAVVVEQDWPEYEPTWAAIEARMAGKPSPLATLPVAVAVDVLEAPAKAVRGDLPGTTTARHLERIKDDLMEGP
jgi:hypothetical protein